MLRSLPNPSTNPSFDPLAIDERPLHPDHAPLRGLKRRALTRNQCGPGNAQFDRLVGNRRQT